MSGRLLVKRYALALYEVAEAENQLDAIETDILSLVELMQEVEIKAFCLKGSLSRNSIKLFMELGLLPVMKNQLMKNFLMTVLDNGRQALLPFLHDAFFEVKDIKNGITSVLIEFAFEPDKKILEHIKAKMTKKLACDVNIHYQVDSDALKGFRIFWNNRLIDRTAKGRIRQLRQALLRT